MDFIAGIITGILLSQIAMSIGRNIDVSNIPNELLKQRKAEIIKLKDNLNEFN